MEKEELEMIKENAELRLQTFLARKRSIPPPLCNRMTVSIERLIEDQRTILKLVEEIEK